jgi:hypothetical protein
VIWIPWIAAAVGAGWLLGGGDAAENLRRLEEAGGREGLLALLGVTAGLCLRDRVRLGRTYASPTLAYVGKALFMAAAGGAATYAFSPVAWPAAVPDALAGAAALGLALWLGNLPRRL